ncbi:MAG: porin [Hyphomicrobiales bacterium]
MLKFDARTMTEYGLLRTFIEMYWTQDSGGDVDTSLERAFIQFGGLTAGAATFFDYGAGFQLHRRLMAVNGPVARHSCSDQSVGLHLAFGNGFSATLSVEDGSFARLFGMRLVRPIFAVATRFPTLLLVHVDQGWFCEPGWCDP